MNVAGGFKLPFVDVQEEPTIKWANIYGAPA